MFSFFSFGLHSELVVAPFEQYWRYRYVTKQSRVSFLTSNSEHRQQEKEYNKNIENTRQRALGESLLMKDAALRQAEREKAKPEGLQIISAWYGDIYHANPEGNAPNVIDVTIPVQFLVEESKLAFPFFTSKAHLDGFYDPCFGVKKYLLVHYQHANQDHCALLDDETPFTLPSPGLFIHPAISLPLTTHSNSSHQEARDRRAHV